MPFCISHQLPGVGPFECCCPSPGNLTVLLRSLHPWQQQSPVAKDEYHTELGSYPPQIRLIIRLSGLSLEPATICRYWSWWDAFIKNSGNYVKIGRWRHFKLKHHPSQRDKELAREAANAMRAPRVRECEETAASRWVLCCVAAEQDRWARWSDRDLPKHLLLSYHCTLALVLRH